MGEYWGNKLNYPCLKKLRAVTYSWGHMHIKTQANQGPISWKPLCGSEHAQPKHGRAILWVQARHNQQAILPLCSGSSLRLKATRSSDMDSSCGRGPRPLSDQYSWRSLAAAYGWRLLDVPWGKEPWPQCHMLGSRTRLKICRRNCPKIPLMGHSTATLCRAQQRIICTPLV